MLKILDFIIDLWALIPEFSKKSDPRWIALSVIFLIIGIFLFLFKWL